MAESSSNKEESGQPAPEVLQPQDESGTRPATPTNTPPAKPRSLRRGSYRPSHRATFIAAIVVVAILGVNAAIIGFVLQTRSKVNDQLNGQVTVNQTALSKLGVDNAPVGDKGIELTVNPNARFKGNVQIGGSLSVGGQLQLNGTFSASNANFLQLKAGKTDLSTLNVNGDGTLNNLNVRKDVVVAGTSRLNGPVVASQLVTINNSLNVTGNLSVGGLLSVAGFHTSSLVSDSTMTVGGHIITRGYAPGFSRYSSSFYGSNGTASISGNDMSGTIGVNVGVGSNGSGCLGHVSFRSRYSMTPHVVLTAQGAIGYTYTRNRTSAGFDVCVGGVDGVGAGGYTIDYIVEQ